jgi:hypothetical protein
MGAGQQQQSQQQSSVGMQGKGGAARPAQQPAAGMGGKGVGQQVLPEYAQPYAADMVQPPQQSNLNNALTALGGTPTYPFPQPPVQQPVQGMGGKGVGQLPYDPIYMDRFPQVQPQSGMGGKGVGQLPPQAGTLNDALMALNQAPAQAPVQVQPAPVEPPPIMGIRTAYNAATGQNLQPTPPRPVQPATNMGSKGAVRSAAKTPQPVRAEQQKVATQRLLQQLASRNRGRGRR